MNSVIQQLQQYQALRRANNTARPQQDALPQLKRPAPADYFRDLMMQAAETEQPVEQPLRTMLRRAA